MSGFHSLDAPLSLTGDDSMQVLLCLWSRSAASLFWGNRMTTNRRAR